MTRFWAVLATSLLLAATLWQCREPQVSDSASSAAQDASAAPVVEPGGRVGQLDGPPSADADLLGIGQKELDAEARAAGASESWWSRVQQRIKASEYAVRPATAKALQRAQAAMVAGSGGLPERLDGPQLQAANRRNGYRTYFLEHGVVVVPREAEMPRWLLHLQTDRLGRGEAPLTSLHEAARPRGADESNRVVYERGGNVREMFDNRPSGLEQSFEIAEPPPGDGPVVVSMAVRGLTPWPVGDDAVLLATAEGSPVLRYHSLEAWDAGGHLLASSIEVRDLIAEGVECRAAVDVCDVAESCSGTSSACPPDGFDELDTDGDGLCDAGDPDDDNDGVLDGSDHAPTDPTQCSHTDGDLCDDCASGQFDPAFDGYDFDGDGLCDAAFEPVCGDSMCDSAENCAECEVDCGVCQSCGDGLCSGTETCVSCEVDCGVCSADCGDGSCGAEETCQSCPADCGSCPALCGDGVCDPGEDASDAKRIAGRAHRAAVMLPVGRTRIARLVRSTAAAALLCAVTACARRRRAVFRVRRTVVRVRRVAAMATARAMRTVCRVQLTVRVAQSPAATGVATQAKTASRVLSTAEPAPHRAATVFVAQTRRV